MQQHELFVKKSAKTLILTSLWPLWAKRNIPAINFTKAALFSKRYLSVMPYKYSGFFHSWKLLSLYLGCPASLLHQTPTERYSSTGWSLTSVSKVWTWVPLTLGECKWSIKVKHILKCILSSGNQISNTWYPSHAAFAVFEHKVRAGLPRFPQTLPLKMWLSLIAYVGCENSSLLLRVERSGRSTSCLWVAILL